MRTTLLVLAVVGLLALTPGLATAGPKLPVIGDPNSPCPNNCWAPEPCGWGPAITDPEAWVEFYTDCAEDEFLRP